MNSLTRVLLGTFSNFLGPHFWDVFEVVDAASFCLRWAISRWRKCTSCGAPPWGVLPSSALFSLKPESVILWTVGHARHATMSFSASNPICNKFAIPWSNSGILGSPAACSHSAVMLDNRLAT